MSSPIFAQSKKEIKINNKLRGSLSDRGIISHPTFFRLEENFQRLPGANADIAITKNLDFEVLGTGADSTSVAFRQGGGITLTTTTSASDSVIIAPHLDSNQTAWAVTNQWLSSKQVRHDFWIQTGASIAATTIWAGLKLTNTPTVATDDDQVFLRYAAATAGGYFQLITSRAGTDVSDTLQVAVAASTLYRVTIEVDDNLLPSVKIRTGTGDAIPQVLSASGAAALVTAKSFIPYIGVQTNTTAAKSLSVLYQSCSRLAA